MEIDSESSNNSIPIERDFLPIAEDTVDITISCGGTCETGPDSMLLNDNIIKQTFTATDFTAELVQIMKPVHNADVDSDTMEEFPELVETVGGEALELPDESEEIPVIPDSLCDRMTHGIFQDPVITPGGITYERQNIEDHLNVVGNFDPITHVRLTADELYPDHRMRIAVDEFISIHPDATNAVENSPNPASIVAEIALEEASETTDVGPEENKTE